MTTSGLPANIVSCRIVIEILRDTAAQHDNHWRMVRHQFRDRSMSNRHRQSILFIATALAVCVIILAGLLAQPSSAAIAGCPMFPANNVWNARVDSLPIDARSAAYITSIGASTGLHPDFGAGLYEGAPIGIPYTIVLGTQPLVTVTFDIADESDPGPYPIPPDAPIEGGAFVTNTGDRHVLVVDRDNCKLYETWSSYRQPDGSWQAGSGAVFTLTSNALRQAGWTSADAAGLPILPGLVRHDEVASGVITHALRFTAQRTQRKYIWPARHYASSITDANVPPMGQRFRLKASFFITPTLSPQVRVILVALKTYGMFLADNGSNWFISGVPDEGWDNDALLNQLRLVRGSDFEAVDESGLMLDPNSGQVKTVNLNPALWLPLIRR